MGIDDLMKYMFKNRFLETTNLIYDSDVSNGSKIGRLPTPKEISRQYPNPCGWNTGMEDSMISAGTILDALCNIFGKTHDMSLHQTTSSIFAGIKLCCRVSGVRGFLARSVSPVDGKSYYFDSSRDQYTHIIHALCNYYDSELSSSTEKEEITDILLSFAEFAKKCVTPENDYSILRADLKLGIVNKMLYVNVHESARLPMFYLAAYHVTGDENWYNEYLKYTEAAIRGSQITDEFTFEHLFVLYQAQLSVRLLYDYEKDNARKEEYARILRDFAKLATGKFEDIPQRVINGEFDLYRPQPDWRDLEMGVNAVIGERLYEVPQKVEHDMNTFWPLSDYGAGVAAVLLDPAHGDASEYKKNLEIILDNIDFKVYDSRGDIYICAAYFMC